MKRLIPIVLLMMVSISSFAQNFYVEPKINVASAAVAILNPAIEVGFGKFSAIEWSNVSAFAQNSYLGSGDPFVLNFNLIEYRAYFLSKEHKGLFAGGNVGWDTFKLTKGMIPIIGTEEQVRDFDWGTGFALGATFGYKWLFKERFGIETSISGGWHLGEHEAYVNDALYPPNTTAEWLLYKAGAYFTYRFGKISR